MLVMSKRKQTQAKKIVLSEKREKISNFFMKKHLLHNIHNNHNLKKNQNTS
jgi:hypothetical protein